MAPTDVGRGMDIDVKTILHYMATLVLGLTFVASMATIGCAARVGVYDPEYRDYHRWDRDEDRAYNDYWRERHEREEYREYGRLNEDQQRDYWKWRHGRSDERRGRDRDDRDRDNRDRDNRERDDRDRR